MGDGMFLKENIHCVNVDLPVPGKPTMTDLAIHSNNLKTQQQQYCFI